MEQTATKFEGTRDDLDSMLSSLLSELDVLQTAWVGRSGSSFTSVKEAYSQNQKVLSRTLGETATAIRSSGQNYTTTDDDSASKVGNIDTNIQLNL